MQIGRDYFSGNTLAYSRMSQAYKICLLGRVFLSPTMVSCWRFTLHRPSLFLAFEMFETLHNISFCGRLFGNKDAMNSLFLSTVLLLPKPQNSLTCSLNWFLFVFITYVAIHKTSTTALLFLSLCFEGQLFA